MDRGDTEPTNQLSPAHTQVPEETETDQDVMKYIPYKDNLEKEYFDNLKEQIREKKEKRRRNINKWNPSSKKKK